MRYRPAAPDPGWLSDALAIVAGSDTGRPAEGRCMASATPTLQDLMEVPPDRRVVILGAGASVECGVPLGSGFLALINERRSEMPTLARLNGDFEPRVAALDFLIESASEGTTANVLKDRLTRTRQGQHAPTTDQLKAERRVLIKLLHASMYHDRTVTVPPRESSYLRALAEFQTGSTIFTLNYDDLLEWAASDMLVSDVDSQDRVVVPDVDGKLTRLLHLHGAITWWQHERTVLDDDEPHDDREDALVLGTGNKLRYWRPFLGMYQAFESALYGADAVLTIGFGFQDDHIVQQLEYWARERGTDGQIHMCLGPDADTPKAALSWRANHAVRTNTYGMSAMALVRRLSGYTDDVLHIESARYGANGRDADVTTRLQDLVEDGRLCIEASNAVLVDDIDPCFGQGKELRVKFTYNDVPGEISVLENETLVLPAGESQT